MTDNPAGAAVTAQDPNKSIPFPTEPDDVILTGDDVAPDDDGSQASNIEADGEADLDAEGQTGEGDGESGDDGDSRAENEEETGNRNKVPAKKRIKQLSQRAREAESRASRAEARASTLARQLHELENRDPVGEAADYQSDAEYAQALVKEAVASAKIDALRDTYAEVASEREAAEADAWAEKTATIRERAPDFDAVITNPSLTITPLMKQTLVADENGPEVVYWLGKNPEEARRIASLKSPVHQVAALGRLSERLSNAPEPRRVTKAGQPRKVLTGQGAPAPKNPAKMNDADYRQWRQQVNAERAKSRR